MSRVIIAVLTRGGCCFSDLGRASENLKPGQSNKEDKRPGTVPRVKKFDFGGEPALPSLGSDC